MYTTVVHMCSSPRRIASFGSFSSAVVSVERVPDANMLATATRDGAVAAWDMDTLQAKFKMRVDGGVTGLHFTSSSHLVLHSGLTVHVILLRHFFTRFAQCSAAPTAAQLVAPGVAMAPCAVRSN